MSDDDDRELDGENGEDQDDQSVGLTDRTWWVQTYDEKGNSYGSVPQPLSVLRKEVIEAWKGSVKDGTIPKPTLNDDILDYIATKEFTAHVGAERDRRSKRLIHDVEYILDAIPEDGAYVDPLLSQVHRIGDTTDAPLRFWTVEMWETWADNRFAKAKKAVLAADEAMELRKRMVAAIRAAKVTYTGDLPQCKQSGGAA